MLRKEINSCDLLEKSYLCGINNNVCSWFGYKAML